MREDLRAASERLAGLDLLRGIAALGVLSVHLPWPHGLRAPLPRGYLAVDLFFVLSGFVIAHAYSQRLSTGTQFRQYCLARVIRLYPLYCLATLIAAAEVLAFAWFGQDGDRNMTVGRLVPSLATALLFLPTPPGLSVMPRALFPLVFPAWSLFWELVVNLAYGAARLWLRTIALALLMLFGAGGLIVGLWAYGHVTLGDSWRGALVGGAQAFFCFFAGCLLFQLRRRYRPPATPILLLAAVLLLSFTPQLSGGWLYDLACMTILFPLLVWLGANATISPAMRAAGDFVGYLSYAVYVLQAPFLLWLAPVSVRLGRSMPIPGVGIVILEAAVILAGSWVLARCFDSPVRNWLRLRLVANAPVPQAETAP